MIAAAGPARHQETALDIELARTFLEVVSTGSFVAAAERLNVTQSTVSTRIRTMEHQLGQPLFFRGKAGATLTPAGVQFQRYAVVLTRTWEQARHEIALPPGYRRQFRVGGQFSLWDRVILRWLPWMQANAPDIALRAEVGLSDGLMRQLVEGILDLGVMYTPQSRPGLVVEQLLEEHLVLVASDPAARDPFDGGYVFVDWGPEFQAAHSMQYAELPMPRLYVGLGSLGLSYILQNGGSGYFPHRVVRPYLEAGELHEVRGAPSFVRPAYVVYPAGDDEVLALALDGLRHTASLEAER